jgi:hypothetical protein
MKKLFLSAGLLVMSLVVLAQSRTRFFVTLGPTFSKFNGDAPGK